MTQTRANTALSRDRRTPLFGAIPTLLSVLFLLTPFLKAQDSSPRISTHLFEITPLVSYGSSANFPTQTAIGESRPGIALDAGPGYGFIVGIHLRDENVVEFRWIRQDSYIQIGSSSIDSPRVKTTLDQFHCGFTNEYHFKNPAPQVAPFITASIGGTSLTSESNLGSTHFSVGIGGGVKFFVSRHLGFRMQAEWSPVFVGAHAPAMCGPGCGLNLGAGLVSRAEMAVGPVLRF